MPLMTGCILPSLADATEWINGYVASDNLLGSPCIIQFWAISCPICKINLPYLQHFLKEFQDSGLQIVSVHMPRMEADLALDKVKATVKELGLNGPCAIDNNHSIGDRFETGGIWPSYFLFDAEGKLRSRAAGVVGIKMAENSLKRLLGTGAKA